MFRLLSPNKTRLLVIGALLLAFSVAAQSQRKSCPTDDSGLKLPAGFCATVFADGIGHARHLVVAPERRAVRQHLVGRELWRSGKPREDGFLVALEDKGGKGKGGRD